VVGVSRCRRVGEGNFTPILGRLEGVESGSQSSTAGMAPGKPPIFKENIAAYLSMLAVEQRASGSTQKQALNALVFLP